MFSSNASSAAGDANYIEDVFNTWLFTGNGSTQTIVNGIDLAGEGGLVWLKKRNTGPNNHILFDTVRGGNKSLISNNTDAQNTETNSVVTFNSDGFTSGIGFNSDTAANLVAWTFREQPKFFDVVTYTGTGSATTFAHNLGSVPGCIIVKRTDAGSSSWAVYHRSLTSAAYGIYLNNTDAEALSTFLWNSTAPTSTVFSVGTGGDVNASGGTYVAYLFAHNAGGFGLTGNDNVISCGSFTDTSGAVNLGYEPQFFLYKSSTNNDNWIMVDTMRGLTGTGSTNPQLYPNTSASETNGFTPYITATGFTVQGVADGTYIYMAIRRGPMKVPTTGTSVFAVDKDRQSSSASTPNYVSNFPVDLGLIKYYTAAVDWDIGSRLTGARYMNTNTTAAEAGSTDWAFDYQNGFGKAGAASTDFIGWMWRRAPGYFDEVCYTGTSGVAQNINHNLGVVPELIILKSRSVRSWAVYAAPQGNQWSGTLDSTFRGNTGSSDWNSTTPTASVFSVGVANLTNSSENYVAYLFATCPGVSKVGSYTGNGSSQTINCGFTGGARFVMIKRTDDTGDWYVWDTARGIVSGNDPHLSLNTTAAEVTTDDTIDTDSTGFVVNQVSATNVNVSSATYIFLAIA